MYCTLQEEFQLQMVRVTQLEEEVQMYREMATNVSLESHRFIYLALCVEHVHTDMDTYHCTSYIADRLHCLTIKETYTTH